MATTEFSAETQDERLAAALAHIGVIVPYAGVLIPLLVWLTNRGKSAFVEFQSLQAFLYRLLLMILPVAIWPLIMLTAFFGAPAASLFDNSGPTGTPTGINYVIMSILVFLPLILGVIFLLFILALVIWGLLGAVMVYMGRPFTYPLLGRLAKRLVAIR